MSAADVTAEYVRQILDYDPETGEFRWKPRSPNMFSDGKHAATHTCAKWNSIYAGHLAGRVCRGYWQIGIGGRRYQSHRLAWLYVTGQDAPDEIDHIDGNPSNNRFANLRQATHAENLRNRGSQSNSTSGIKGVTWDRAREKWRAEITNGVTRIFIGRFDTKEDAASAYARAALDVHGEFARAS
jgi:hypothetical protein